MSTYGYDRLIWEKAKTEAQAILVDRAGRRTNQNISYSELAKFITSISFDPHDHAFHALLGQISEEEDAQGKGMLSVLVIHKTGDQMPGPGFFELAHKLGRDAKDKIAFWTNEVRYVLDAHKK